MEILKLGLEFVLDKTRVLLWVCKMRFSSGKLVCKLLEGHVIFCSCYYVFCFMDPDILISARTLLQSCQVKPYKTCGIIDYHYALNKTIFL